MQLPLGEMFGRGSVVRRKERLGASFLFLQPANESSQLRCEVEKLAFKGDPLCSCRADVTCTLELSRAHARRTARPAALIIGKGS